MDIESPQPDEKKWPTKKILIVGIILAIFIFSVTFWVMTRSSTKPKSTSSPTPVVSLKAPKVGLSLYASGLPHPTGIVSTGQKSDTNLFVLDQSGMIRIVKRDGTVATEPFLDITDKVTYDGEMGLLGLAFSPTYAKDGNFFVDYIDKNQNTVIARYHATSATKADMDSSQTVLTLKQPYTNHNGGDLVFGPKGYLYITLGDGGSAGDPGNRAQDLSVLFGKILRLDVSTLPYKIPVDNPFVNQPGAAPEIWDYGLRNPWRISFDSKTNDLYIADVGQDQHEEVDIEAAPSKGGNNFGWRCFEANEDYNLTGCKAKDQYVFPVTGYDHSSNRCSVTGGYVYRGQKYPALNGKYFYSDYCNGDIYWAEKASSSTQPVLATGTPYKITTFGVDNQAELYLADSSTGNIYQIQDSANPSQ